MTASGAAPDFFDASDERPVHFVGVAGAGMSALAELLVTRGVKVTGCDAAERMPDDLRRLGIPLTSGHDPAHVDGCRAVVVTSAVARTHPELQRARSLGLPVLRRAEALAAALSSATIVGVAGTHGKTTTTVLTTDALVAAGRDPTGLAGGRVPAWGGNLWRGGDSLVVVEADEYDRSFLELRPSIAVVTNVEEDHLDIYSGIDDIRRAFEQFLQPARVVVVCADDPIAANLALPADSEVISYGISDAGTRLRASNLQPERGGSRFTVSYDGRQLGDVRLAAPGRHNVLNALGAIGCGFALGATLDEMRQGIEGFAGVERRFQRLGSPADVHIIDDYAHHPTEIAAAIAATREAYPEARLIAAFQPHLYSRTRDFAPVFAESLARADAVFLADIYGAREQPIAGVTSALIGDALTRAKRTVQWAGPRTALASELSSFARAGDVVLLMGAGDITTVAYELRDLLTRRSG